MHILAFLAFPHKLCVFFLERAISSDWLSDLKGALDMVYDSIAIKDLFLSCNVSQK